VIRHLIDLILYGLRPGGNPQIQTDYYDKSNDSQFVLVFCPICKKTLVQAVALERRQQMVKARAQDAHGGIQSQGWAGGGKPIHPH
jgi:hypothetical protein